MTPPTSSASFPQSASEHGSHDPESSAPPADAVDFDALWRSAIEAIRRGEVAPEVERAVVEAARQVKRRRKIARRHDAQHVRDVLRARTGRVRRSEGASDAATALPSTGAPALLADAAPHGGPPHGAAPHDAVDNVPPRPAHVANAPVELPNHSRCYICKQMYRALHPYYHRLCVTCGDASFARRTPTMNLEGRRAILTGGRTKVGYQAALLLLRAGAHVTVTTRYPHDAARRYAAEPDYATFGSRLRVAQVDFRDLRAQHGFLDAELARGEPLDILINLAAQTIRASAALERAERARDADLARQLPEPTGEALVLAAGGPLVKDADHGEWADATDRNSWDLDLGDVPLAEFFEVQLVNVFAPWAFTNRLLPLLRASRFEDRYVIQVSAVEGQFAGAPKSGKHPHTNMAKAALHMLVHTSAAPLAEDGIYMNAVDPGWVSDQSAVARRSPDRRFCPPLDVVDGAARVVDPIARGLAGDRPFGLLLKDFAPVSF